MFASEQELSRLKNTTPLRMFRVLFIVVGIVLLLLLLLLIIGILPANKYPLLTGIVVGMCLLLGLIVGLVNLFRGPR